MRCDKTSTDPKKHVGPFKQERVIEGISIEDWQACGTPVLRRLHHSTQDKRSESGTRRTGGKSSLRRLFLEKLPLEIAESRLLRNPGWLLLLLLQLEFGEIPTNALRISREPTAR